MLMAAYVGLPWKRVVMLPSPRVVWDQDELWKARPCSRALVSAAGPAADTLYERKHPEDGDVHEAGSLEDMMAVQTCALQVLGLVPTKKSKGERIRVLKLKPAQGYKSRLWMAAVQMMALEWTLGTTPFREAVAQMLHDKGQIERSDIDLPPPGTTEKALFSKIADMMVMLKNMPKPTLPPDGKVPHFARVHDLMGQLADRAAGDDNVMAALDNAVRHS